MRPAFFKRIERRVRRTDFAGMALMAAGFLIALIGAGLLLTSRGIAP
jgi:hypothetical protein